MPICTRPPDFHLSEQREMDERHAVSGSRSAAFGSVMKPANLRYCDNLAFIGRLDWTGCPRTDFSLVRGLSQGIILPL